MSDLASIAAELRRVLPMEYWPLLDKLVNYVLDDIMRQFRETMKEVLRGIPNS